MRAVVLAAGRGSRLGSLTDKIPKVLLPIGGEPLIAHTLRYLAANNYREVALNLHHGAELVRKEVGEGSRFGVRIHYSYERHLLGTAGALRRLQAWIRDEALVLYGDVFTNQDLGPLRKLHKEVGAAATLIVHQRARSNSAIRLASDGRILEFHERPETLGHSGEMWVNSGIQLLSARLIGRIGDGPSDLARDVYPRVLNEELLYGLPLSGYRCAIDSIERYTEAQIAFSEGRYAPADE